MPWESLSAWDIPYVSFFFFFFFRDGVSLHGNSLAPVKKTLAILFAARYVGLTECLYSTYSTVTPYVCTLLSPGRDTHFISCIYSSTYLRSKQVLYFILYWQIRETGWASTTITALSIFFFFPTTMHNARQGAQTVYTAVAVYIYSIYDWCRVYIICIVSSTVDETIICIYIYPFQDAALFFKKKYCVAGYVMYRGGGSMYLPSRYTLQQNTY